MKRFDGYVHAVLFEPDTTSTPALDVGAQLDKITFVARMG